MIIYLIIINYKKNKKMEMSNFNINSNVLLAQPSVFSLYEEYDGIVYGETKEGTLVRTNKGGWGIINFNNFGQDSFLEESEITVKIIGFLPDGLMELIPTETMICKFGLQSPSYDATVELVSGKAVLLSFEGEIKTGLYKPGKQIDLRWQALIPGQKVKCIAYQTRCGFFVNGIIAVTDDNGKILPNFDRTVFNQGKEAGSLEKQDNIKLGFLYSAIVQPSRTILMNTCTAVTLKYNKNQCKPEDFSNIIVRISYINPKNGAITALFIGVIE